MVHSAVIQRRQFRCSSGNELNHIIVYKRNLEFCIKMSNERRLLTASFTKNTPTHFTNFHTSWGS